MLRLASLFTDPTVDRWTSLAPEKIDHVIYGVALWGIFLRFLPFEIRVFVFLALAIGWEVLELIRYELWQRKSAPQPRPEICDLFSYKDVCRDVLGAVLAALLLLLPARL